MDKTNLKFNFGIEKGNSKTQVDGKLGHEVQIHVFRLS